MSCRRTLLLICSSHLLFTGLVGCCTFGYDVSCIYPCHCEAGAVCDSTTGECPNGCDDGDLNGFEWRGNWSGPGCQVGNVAYGRDTTCSDTHAYATSCSRAVDGNLDPDYNNDHCTHARNSNGQIAAWWMVDLSDFHVILNVTIINRDTNPRLLDDTYVEVQRDNGTYEECGRITGAGDEVVMTCNPPIVGRYVRLRRQSGAYREGRTTLCEVMVYGYIYKACSDRTYGPGCLKPCNCQDQCGFVTAVCPTQCMPGWKDNDCQSPCEDGTWGDLCSKTCMCLRESEVCDHVTGSCTECAARHVGTGCDAVTPSLSSAPIVTMVELTTLDVVFRAWMGVNDPLGDPPSGYLVQLRPEGSHGWQTLQEIPGLQTANVTCTVDVSHLERASTYYIRVLPYLDYEGERHEGDAPEVSFISSTPTPGSGAPAAAIAVPVVMIIVAIPVVVILVVLWRKRSQKSRSPSAHNHQILRSNIAEVGTSNANGIVNVGLNIDDEESKVTTPEPNPSPPTNDSAVVAAEEGLQQYENIYNNQSLPGKLIKVKDLPVYVADIKENPENIKFEYSQIPQGQKAKWDIGKMTVNMGKNRFHNILAYDHARVMLDVEKKGEEKGYINASFIPSYTDDAGYIAAQAPRIHTVPDFWQMIWEHNVNRVVMLTNIMEAGKAKCEWYWPDLENMTEQEYGKFTVKLLKTEKFADYTIRSLSLVYKETTRSVTQYHFVSWPDHGVPPIATSILELRRKLHAQDAHSTGPVLVHCSAGVGRTGTFIALDYLLEQAKAERELDVCRYVTLMRTCRIDMIQTLEQYTFLYNALIQALAIGESAIPCHQMSKMYPSLIKSKPNSGETVLDKQFALLESIKPLAPEEPPKGASSEHLSKNRDPDIIPGDRVRPLLHEMDGRSTYINAAYIAGYRQKDAYIATQLPLENTVCDLWRLLMDHNSTSLIAIHDVDPWEEQSCKPYWPTSTDDKLTSGPLEVSLITSEERDVNGVTVREFAISNTLKTGNEPFTVKVFHLQGWSEKPEVPDSPDAILSLLERVESWQQKSGNGPVTIQCKNGAHQTGLVCAASYLLEKLKIDQEVDVYLTVAQIRLGRPQFIASMEQYKFLHELAMVYMDKYAAYANFK